MARSLVLGNGNILVCFGHHGQVRDFYFPYVGLEDHVAPGDAHRVGIFVDGQVSWLDDGKWIIQIDYESETMVSKIIAYNENLRINLEFTDIVYNEKNILIRHLKVKNDSDRERLVKVFFNQQFQISRTTHADTVYYNPHVEALIHYKGRRVFLVGGSYQNKTFTEYSTGLFKTEGKDGTWRDAEDGVLSGNPIEHGAVDSTIAFALLLGPGAHDELDYWVAVGETFREVCALQDYLKAKSPHHLIETTRDFWHAWVNKFDFTFYGLSNESVAQFKKSLLIIRTHCDNQGGILASGDSDNFQYGRDTYGYVWPRDGVFVSMALDATGYFDIAHRFYAFCNEVVSEGGYILHKYQPDRSLGSSWHPWIKNGKIQLAIQEDETALILYGLWLHYRKSRDLEFVESLYNSFIKKTADFIDSYIDEGTGLPKPSYDLWEEQRSVSTFTSAVVYGALTAAANFASLLGKENDKERYTGRAKSVRQAILKYFFNPQKNYFYKSLTLDETGKVDYDETIDASAFYGVYRFEVLEEGDGLLKKAHQTLKAVLGKTIPVGGVARYERDRYYQINEGAPANPWFVTTLWNVQYELMAAVTESEVASVAKKLDWVTRHATTAGMLSEQLNPYSGEQLSVTPLIWSHAEYVLTIIRYLEKLEELGVCTVCYPVR